MYKISAFPLLLCAAMACNKDKSIEKANHRSSPGIAGTDVSEQGEMQEAEILGNALELLATDGNASWAKNSCTIPAPGPCSATCSGGSRWQNPTKCLDVNNDGLVSAIDALFVTNAINSGATLGLTPPYLDTSGDGYISAIDALLVINYVNSGCH